MHIALFHQYHHNPDCPATCRHYTFLAELAKRHRITLVTADAWEQKRLTHAYDWVPRGVELVSLAAPYSNKMNVWQRLQAFGSYGLKALAAGIRLERPDVVWGVSTPLTAAWAAAQVARWHKLPWVFEVQDLWPDFPIQMGGIRNRLLQRQLYALERNLYKSASHIIPLSPDMAQHIQNKGISPEKITTLVNGADLDWLQQPAETAVAEIRERYGIGSRNVILYAGTYGRANDIPTLLQAAELMQAQEDVCWVFTGQGFYEDALKEAAAKGNNIVLAPPQPRQHIFNWFRLAAVSVVSFIDLPVLKANSPGKFFDSLAAGTPVVVTNAGWTKEFVEEHRCGWFVPAGKPQQLAQRLSAALREPEALKAAGLKGAEAARAHFDRQLMVEVLEKVLLQAGRCNG